MPRKGSKKMSRKNSEDKQELWEEYVDKIFNKYFPPKEVKKMSQAEINQRSCDLMSFILFKLKNDPPDFLKEGKERDNLISQIEIPIETTVI